MEANRQIYEKMPAFVSVPQEMRDRKVEIVFLILDGEQIVSTTTESSDALLPDYEVLRFAGCLPDFPECDSPL